MRLTDVQLAWRDASAGGARPPEALGYLETPLRIFNPATPANFVEVAALVDTGSNVSSLGQEIYAKLAVQTVARIPTLGIGQTAPTEIGVVTLQFSNHFALTTLIQSQAQLGKGRQAALIGMDVLGFGEFAVDGPGRRARLRLPDATAATAQWPGLHLRKAP